MKRKVFILSAIGLIAVLTTGFLFIKPNPVTSSGGPLIAKKLMPKHVRILPLGPGCSEAFIRETQQKIQQFIPTVDVLPAAELPASAYYKPRGRYRADSLIQWIGRMAKKDEVILGITNVDISATRNEIPDWGVMGLGFRPGNAAIASTRRLKDRCGFWKVAVHELGHTAGLEHCPDKSCYMRSAEGGNPTAEETSFCSLCMRELTKAGWKMED